MIRLENIGKQNGKQIVFIEASATLLRGEKAGVVGPNGAGKTTLLRALAEGLRPHSSRVTQTSGLSVGYLRQGHELLGATVRDVIVGGRADHVWTAEPETRDQRRDHHCQAGVEDCVEEVLRGHATHRPGGDTRSLSSMGVPRLVRISGAFLKN